MLLKGYRALSVLGLIFVWLFPSFAWKVGNVYHSAGCGGTMCVRVFEGQL